MRWLENIIIIVFCVFCGFLGYISWFFLFLWVPLILPVVCFLLLMVARAAKSRTSQLLIASILLGWLLRLLLALVYQFFVHT